MRLPAGGGVAWMRAGRARAAPPAWAPAARLRRRAPPDRAGRACAPGGRSRQRCRQRLRRRPGAARHGERRAAAWRRPGRRPRHQRLHESGVSARRIAPPAPAMLATAHATTKLTPPRRRPDRIQSTSGNQLAGATPSAAAKVANSRWPKSSVGAPLSRRLTAVGRDPPRPPQQAPVCTPTSRRARRPSPIAAPRPSRRATTQQAPDPVARSVAASTSATPAASVSRFSSSASSRSRRRRQVPHLRRDISRAAAAARRRRSASATLRTAGQKSARGRRPGLARPPRRGTGAAGLRPGPPRRIDLGPFVRAGPASSRPDGSSAARRQELDQRLRPAWLAAPGASRQQPGGTDARSGSGTRRRGETRQLRPRRSESAGGAGRVKHLQRLAGARTRARATARRSARHAAGADRRGGRAAGHPGRRAWRPGLASSGSGCQSFNRPQWLVGRQQICSLAPFQAAPRPHRQGAQTQCGTGRRVGGQRQSGPDRRLVGAPPVAGRTGRGQMRPGGRPERRVSELPPAPSAAPAARGGEGILTQPSKARMAPGGVGAASRRTSDGAVRRVRRVEGKLGGGIRWSGREGPGAAPGGDAGKKSRSTAKRERLRPGSAARSRDADQPVPAGGRSARRAPPRSEAHERISTATATPVSRGFGGHHLATQLRVVRLGAPGAGQQRQLAELAEVTASIRSAWRRARAGREGRLVEPAGQRAGLGVDQPRGDPAAGRSSPRPESRRGRSAAGRRSRAPVPRAHR